MPGSTPNKLRTGIPHPARALTTRPPHALPVALLCLTLFGCADDRPTAESDNDAFIVGGGLLTLDTRSAGARDVFAADHDGHLLAGVVVLRPGLSITVDDGPARTIEASPRSLSVFDGNGDGQIDAADPLWQSLHLAVDYNEDGTIGDGEYALIGECGIEALRLDPAADQIWSVHKRGKEKAVRPPGQNLQS